MRVLIRADASPRLGTGHVMRMLALASGLKALNAEVELASTVLVPALAERARRAGVPTHRVDAAPGSASDAEWTAARAQASGAEWVVGDGYELADEFQQTLSDAGLSLLLVDDFGHANRYQAELVLNPGLGAHAALYDHRSPRTQLLLGPRFALLRRQFEPAPLLRTIAPRATRLLVTLGGADPDDATAQVVDALGALPDAGWRARVLIGSANPRAAELAKRVGDRPIELLTDVEDVAAQMAWADLAIASAGGTHLELCRMGLPALVLVLADNQVSVAQAMEAVGAGENVGWAKALGTVALAKHIEALRGDAARRASMRECGRAVVDGCGVRRVIDAMYPGSTQGGPV